MFIDINFVAVVAAAVANFIIGMTWYSPVLFAKPFIKALGRTPKEFEDQMKNSNMPKILTLSMIANLLQAFVLAYFMNLMNVGGFVQGASVGFLAWLGFVVVTQFTHYLYETNKFELFTIGAGYQLTALVVMGAIIGAL